MHLSTRKKIFLKGAFVLTFVGLVTRVIGFFFRIFLSRAFGTEGIGIYHLIFPVFALCISLSAAGIETSLSRLTARYTSLGRPELAKVSFQMALLLSAGLSLICTALIQIFAHDIAVSALGDVRCEPLLKVMSYALPFASVHSCICGYSLGLKQTRIPGISQLAEQCARVLGVYLLYTAAIQESGQAGIILAVCGLVIGEIAGTFYSIFAVRRILYTKKAAQKCSVSCYAGCLGRYFKTCRTYHGQPDFFEYSSEHRGRFHSKVPHALRLLPLRSPEPLRNPERDRHALYFVSVCHHQFHLHDDAPHCGRDSGSKPEPDSEAADPEGKYLLPSAWIFLYLRFSSDRGLSRLLCLSKSGRPPPTYGCWLLSARFSIQIRPTSVC